MKPEHNYNSVRMNPFMRILAQVRMNAVHKSVPKLLQRIKNELSEPGKRERKGDDFKEIENMLKKGAARPESQFELPGRAGLEKQVHCCSSQEQEKFFPTPH